MEVGSMVEIYEFESNSSTFKNNVIESALNLSL